MKVLLENRSQAISNIVNSCCDKLGYSVQTIGNPDDFDLVIKDCDVLEDITGDESKTIYLVARNLINTADKKYLLSKPFLLTDLANLISKVSSSLTPKSEIMADKDVLSLNDLGVNVGDYLPKASYRGGDDGLSISMDDLEPVLLDENLSNLDEELDLEALAKSLDVDEQIIPLEPIEEVKQKVTNFADLGDDIDLNALALEMENVSPSSDYIKVDDEMDLEALAASMQEEELDIKEDMDLEALAKSFEDEGAALELKPLDDATLDIKDEMDLEALAASMQDEIKDGANGEATLDIKEDMDLEALAKSFEDEPIAVQESESLSAKYAPQIEDLSAIVKQIDEMGDNCEYELSDLDVAQDSKIGALDISVADESFEEVIKEDQTSDVGKFDDIEPIGVIELEEFEPIELEGKESAGVDGLKEELKVALSSEIKSALENSALLKEALKELNVKIQISFEDR